MGEPLRVIRGGQSGPYIDDAYLKALESSDLGGDRTARPDDALPPLADLAAEQVERAVERLHRDLSKAPCWEWSDLDALTGPMLPGDLVVVGSLMGNGKSTLLMSQMDAFARRKMATLYVPLEIDPEICRTRWAAWVLGYNPLHAIRHHWHKLPEGAEEAIECLLHEQKADPYIHFVPDKRLTLTKIIAWCRHAKEENGCAVVMLDHFHRLDFGQDAASHRISVTESARRFKDALRELEMVGIAAAQLNRTNDPIDRYTAPSLARIKESAGIGEEADVALMLSRKLKRDLPDQWANKLRVGALTEDELAERDVMVVTCRKHRLDNSALDRRVLLTVRNGRIESLAPSWRIYP